MQNPGEFVLGIYMLPSGPLDLPAVLEKPDEPEQQSLM